MTNIRINRLERKILVSAYGCEPLKGSEPGIGWNWILQMAKYNYLHVITRANNKQVIEAHLPDDLKHRITFHYYDTPNCIKRLKNKAKGLYFYYFCWQIGIVPLVRRILKKKGWITPCTLRLGVCGCLHFSPYLAHLSFGGLLVVEIVSLNLFLKFYP